MNKLEEEYTATDAKLLKHLDRLQEIRGGTFRPITLEVAPTNKCNLDCVFCSVRDRDKSQELDFMDLQTAIGEFRKMGLKSLEITGGGEPSLYPEINHLISINSHDLDVGMISNGIGLEARVSKEALNDLTWLRVSMNGLDYGFKPDLPKIRGTLGLSYVWNQFSNSNMMAKILMYKKESNAEYVRIVPDCLSVLAQEEFRETIAPKIEKMYGKHGFFAQSKPYSVPDRCWWGYLKPFLNADGYIYRCSANPLLNRKFGEEFRMGRMEDVKKIWADIKPFDTKYCETGKCFFKPQNDLVEAVMGKGKHEKFI